MPKKKDCINTLLLKIGGVDKKIGTLTERLEYVKNMVNEYCFDNDVEEECPDVAESEKALVQAIEKLYVEELLTREPEGEA